MQTIGDGGGVWILGLIRFLLLDISQRCILSRDVLNIKKKKNQIPLFEPYLVKIGFVNMAHVSFLIMSADFHISIDVSQRHLSNLG